MAQPVIIYRSTIVSLDGTLQTFTAPSMKWGYCEVHNFGSNPVFCRAQSADLPVPPGGRLAITAGSSSGPTGEPANGVTLQGFSGETALIYWASSVPPYPIVQPNALGGGGGGGTTYNADGVTLQLAGTTFSIKNDGVDTLQLANDAVTTQKLQDDAVRAPKIAPDSLMGFHVDSAINVSPPEGQLYVLNFVGPPTPGDTFQLTVTFGVTPTTISQEWIYDAAPGPGQIAITSTANPSDDFANAVGAWAVGLPLGTLLNVGTSVLNGVCWMSFMDDAAISVGTSSLAWSGSTPSNCTILAGPVLPSLTPVSQPLRVATRIVTSVEAGANVVEFVPATQLMYFTPPLVQIWTPVGPDVWAPSAAPIVAIESIAGGTRWQVQAAFSVGDYVVACFGNPFAAAVTPNPFP